MVLTPIYWDPAEFLRHVEAKEESDFFAWLEQTDHLRQEILDGVDLILPNGRQELQLLVEKYRLITPARVIPNGVDPLFFYAKPDKFINRYQLKDFILCVGRICRRKNQKALITAAADLGKTVVLIGPINDYQYYQECRQAGKLKFLGPLPRPGGLGLRCLRPSCPGELVRHPGPGKSGSGLGRLPCGHDQPRYRPGVPG